jgi:hypothetical protein
MPSQREEARQGQEEEVDMAGEENSALTAWHPPLPTAGDKAATQQQLQHSLYHLHTW